jgi:hypothetical protein
VESSSDPLRDVADLVLKALDSLTAEERRQVLSALVVAAIAPTAATHPARPHEPPALSTAGWFGHPRQSSGRPSSVLPVRLPADQLERLRSWCTDHGFSMAVVIRGLVERFLDDQSRRS